MKGENFNAVLEHKNNELHIPDDVGSHFVSWYLLSIQEKALIVLGIHKEVKFFYWLLTDNFPYA